MRLGFRECQELLTSERARIRRLFTDPKQPPIEPELNNALLEQTFGTFRKSNPQTDGSSRNHTAHGIRRNRHVDGRHSGATKNRSACGV